MWHVSDKIRRNVLVSSDQGLMIVNRFDHNQNMVGNGQFILDHGNICTVEANACINAIRHIEKPIIFDIGANIGAFTTWMSNYFPNGKIYSFEPQRLVFQMLCGNLAINNLFNVHAYNMALGKENSRIEFLEPNYNQPNDFGTFSLVNDTINKKSDRSIIDLCTLDAFVNGFNITNIDLIKVDVEGMDIDVLQGAKTTIERFKPVIFVEYFDNNRSIKEELEYIFNQLNYSIEVIGNNILGISK